MRKNLRCTVFKGTVLPLTAEGFRDRFVLSCRVSTDFQLLL